MRGRAEAKVDNRVAEKVRMAIRRLLDKDVHLLRVDASERSISHRLGLYLADEFHDWDVDCEYNRDDHEVKRLRLLACVEGSSNGEGNPVYPDVIIHKRGTRENLLVIEIKKSTSSVPEEHDINKLKAFKDELGYQYGLFLMLKCAEEQCDVEKAEWF